MFEAGGARTDAGGREDRTRPGPRGPRGAREATKVTGPDRRPPRFAAPSPAAAEGRDVAAGRAGAGGRAGLGGRVLPAGRALAVAAVLVVTAAACGGPPQVPPPRPLILHSGARLSPERERLRDIDEWIRPQIENIRQDPSFLIRTVTVDSTVYPWEGLRMQGDTAEVEMRGGLFQEARIPYLIYAHLHLMEGRGELGEWLPDVASGSEFEVERAILARTADAWLYGRSAWDAPPHEPLDEIVYARENDYLEAMIFTARPEEFVEARRAWLRDRPGAIEEYRRWFLDTFGREPPGLREDTASSGDVP